MPFNDAFVGEDPGQVAGRAAIGWLNPKVLFTVGGYAVFAVGRNVDGNVDAVGDEFSIGKRSRRSRSEESDSGRILMATVRWRRVARAVDFAHAACAEWGLNFVGAEFGAGGEGHARRYYFMWAGVQTATRDRSGRVIEERWMGRYCVAGFVAGIEGRMNRRKFLAVSTGVALAKIPYGVAAGRE